MKAKFGAVVVAGSGKIGGHVASRNRGGAYFRTKVTPLNPRSTFQSVVRSTLSLISQQWRELTEAQRSAWNKAVADFKSTNIFGDIVNPSGFNLYQKLNNNILQVGGSMITDPPVPSTAGLIDTLSLTASTTAKSIAYTSGEDADSVMMLYATPPLSQGKSFVKSDYRLVEIVQTNTGSPHVFTAPYLARFGTQGAIGQKVFVKAFLISTVTGIASQPREAYVVMTA